MEDGKKEKERSKKWAGLAHQAAHVPVPSRHGLSQTLHRCSSRSLLSTTRSASSPSPWLHPSLSPDALLCSPLSGAPLLPSLATPLPDLQPLPSPSRSSIWWRNGAEDGEEAAESSGIDEETAESREHQLEHKATRRRFTPKASLERPDALKTLISDQAS